MRTGGAGHGVGRDTLFDREKAEEFHEVRRRRSVVNLKKPISVGRLCKLLITARIDNPLTRHLVSAGVQAALLQPSNVDSTLSMIKAKFRDHIRSRYDGAMNLIQRLLDDPKHV